jgi:hypothetical protein
MPESFFKGYDIDVEGSEIPPTPALIFVFIFLDVKHEKEWPRAN